MTPNTAPRVSIACFRNGRHIADFPFASARAASEHIYQQQRQLELCQYTTSIDLELGLMTAVRDDEVLAMGIVEAQAVQS